MEPCSFIIASGAELVRGEVEDRNSPWLARALLALGYPAKAVHLVPDDEAVLRSSLEKAREAGASVAVLTGGLGPTEDDRTRQAVAAFARADLKEHPDLARRLRAFLKARKRSPSPAAMRQARLPAGASPMINPVGTASGFYMDGGGMRIIALPGPPLELRATAGNDWKELAGALPGGGEEAAILRVDTFGLTEVEVDPLLDDARAVEGVTVGTLALDGTVGVVLSARGSLAREKVEKARKAVVSRLGRCAYGEGGESLPEVLVRLLKANGITIATAESCTGGLVGHMLTSVPGVSDVYLEGVVAYSSAAKTSRLGVPKDLLRRVGAVSEDVAMAMARGVAERAGADLGIGITGIAGPGGGTEEKPVGLVFIASACKGREEARRLQLMGLNRKWVKQLSALSALDLARRMVLGP